MHGYETKEARTAQIRSLARELADVKRAIDLAKDRLEGTPRDQRVLKAQRQEELARLEERIPEIEEQLRAYKGESPHKRAAKRGETVGVETR